MFRIFSTKRASLYVDLFNLYINPNVKDSSVVYGSASIGIIDEDMKLNSYQGYHEIEKIMKYFTKSL